MVEKNMCEVCGSGDGRCGSCGNMCGYRGNHMLRWLLGIIIITWIFCIGMKFGEFKAQVYGGGYGNHMYFKASGMPMMGTTGWGNVDYTVSTQAVPSMMTTGAVKVIKAQ